MARSQLVDDELWELVKPLLPGRTPQRTGEPPEVLDQRPAEADDPDSQPLPCMQHKGMTF